MKSAHREQEVDVVDTAGKIELCNHVVGVFDLSDKSAGTDRRCEKFTNVFDLVQKMLEGLPEVQASPSAVRALENTHIDTDQSLRERVDYLGAIMHDLVEKQEPLINRRSQQARENQKLTDRVASLLVGQTDTDTATQRELYDYRDFIDTAKLAQRKMNSSLRGTAEKANVTQAELPRLKARVEPVIFRFRAQAIRHGTGLEEAQEETNILTAQKTQPTDKSKKLQEQVDMELIEIGELRINLQQRRQEIERALNMALLSNPALEAENEHLKSVVSGLQAGKCVSTSPLIYIGIIPVSTDFCPAKKQA